MRHGSVVSSEWFGIPVSPESRTGVNRFRSCAVIKLFVNRELKIIELKEAVRE